MVLIVIYNDSRFKVFFSPFKTINKQPNSIFIELSQLYNINTISSLARSKKKFKKIKNKINSIQTSLKIMKNKQTVNK